MCKLGRITCAAGIILWSVKQAMCIDLLINSGRRSESSHRDYWQQVLGHWELVFFPSLQRLQQRTINGNENNLFIARPIRWQRISKFRDPTPPIITCSGPRKATPELSKIQNLAHNFCAKSVRYNFEKREGHLADKRNQILYRVFPLSLVLVWQLPKTHLLECKQTH